MITIPGATRRIVTEAIDVPDAKIDPKVVAALLKLAAANDDDGWEEDGPIEALPGGASHGGDAGTLADMLLQTTAAVSTIGILLKEAEDTEWKAVAVRLRAFFAAVQELPELPTPRRGMGFRVVAKKKRAKKRGAKR